MHGVRRDEMPGSEMKDSLLLRVIAAVRDLAFICKFPKPLLSQAEYEEGQMRSAHAGEEHSCLRV